MNINPSCVPIFFYSGQSPLSNVGVKDLKVRNIKLTKSADNDVKVIPVRLEPKTHCPTEKGAYGVKVELQVFLRLTIQLSPCI